MPKVNEEQNSAIPSIETGNIKLDAAPKVSSHGGFHSHTFYCRHYFQCSDNPCNKNFRKQVCGDCANQWRPRESMEDFWA